MSVQTMDRLPPQIDQTYRNGTYDEPPVSADAARNEQAELLDSLRGIDAQLGQGFMMIPDGTRRMNMKEYDDWRRRALDARRHTERRYRFIKQWLHESVQNTPFNDASDQSSVSGDLRGLAKRIGGIEAIAVAAVTYVSDQSDANLNVLVEQVRNHAAKVWVG